MPDRDEILHRVQSWEELLSLGDPLQALPPEATADDPLQMYVGRGVLEAIVEDNIAAIHANCAGMDTTPERKALTDQMLRRRERFLGWVRRFPGVNIFVALHPVPEFEAVEDEGEDDDGALADDSDDT